MWVPLQELEEPIAARLIMDLDGVEEMLTRRICEEAARKADARDIFSTFGMGNTLNNMVPDVGGETGEGVGHDRGGKRGGTSVCALS
jgi:hypothetical protein